LFTCWIEKCEKVKLENLNEFATVTAVKRFFSTNWPLAFQKIKLVIGFIYMLD
jgi:hypothetical protein